MRHGGSKKIILEVFEDEETGLDTVDDIEKILENRRIWSTSSHSYWLEDRP